MSNKFPGGFVVKNPTTPTTSAASGIWTLDQAMMYKSKNTWPLPNADIYYSNVTMLLLGDTLTDSTGKNTLTVSGNTSVNTTTKKYGTGSIYFDGSGDGIYAPTNSAYAFGTGDYTVEFWMNMSSYSGTYTILYAGGCALSFGDSGYGYYLKYSPDSTIDKNYSTSLTGQYFASAGWKHIAVTRQSGVGRFFLDGVQQMLANVSVSASNPNPGSFPNATVPTTENLTTSEFYIGTGSAGVSPYTGYIDELRITKGVARYTSNFTPPLSFAS